MPFSFSTSEGRAKRQAQTDAGTNPLDGLTLAQALAWIDSNVTDLASARTALKQETKLIFLLRREVAELKRLAKELRGN